MQSLAEIKSILDSCGVRPKRSLGQNFLTDHNLIRKLVDAAKVQHADLVLEVGPGTGTMTEELLDRGARVIAAELDDTFAGLLVDRMAERLRSSGQDHANFTLIHGDCLDTKHAVSPHILAALCGRPFKLVANLPYGAATPLMMNLLIDHPQCDLLAVTIQKEVADRLLARPQSKDFGPLAVIAQTLCMVERVATCPPECFWPRPEVTSTMVLLTRRGDALTSDARQLSEACRLLFAQRRKQIGGLLARSVDWNAAQSDPACAGVLPTMRAEQLGIRQIVALSRWIRPGV